MAAAAARDIGRENSLIKMLTGLKFHRLQNLSPHCLYTVSSTQDYLSAEIKSKSEGDFAVSEIQTAGRGRGKDRLWFSDAGGLYLSIVLTPRHDAFVQGIPRMCTTSVLEVFQKQFPLSDCSIKEPNDIVCRRKKIAGVLVDATVKGEETIAYAGIGINLNNGSVWNEELRMIATSFLIESGTEVSIDNFLVTLLQRLDQNYHAALSSSCEQKKGERLKSAA